MPIPVGGLLTIDSIYAMLMGWVFGLPTWWLPIQGLFVPTLVFASALSLPPSMFLVGFVLLWLVFRSNLKERVPLYLSNASTWRALAELLPQQGGFAFLDMGCGLGGALTFLSARRVDGEFHGVESAPLPFVVSWLRLRRQSNGRVRFGDMWRVNLADYDVVYAFLSPSPMQELWCKARSEMRPGSLLVSNSFDVPGIQPSRTLTLDDARRTRLLIWKM